MSFVALRPPTHLQVYIYPPFDRPYPYHHPHHYPHFPLLFSIYCLVFPSRFKVICFHDMFILISFCFHLLFNFLLFHLPHFKRELQLQLEGR